MYDLAYVGSKSDDLLRQVQINAVPRGAAFLPRTRTRRVPPSATPGANALPTDLLRPYQGYGAIRMWDYSGYSNYHSLQTGINRRFDDGFMFSFFYVWSKALGINNDDFAAGLPNATDEEVRRLDYGLRGHGSSAQLRRQLRLPAAVARQRQRGGADRQRLAAVGRLPLDERHAARRRLQHPGHQLGEPDGQRRRQPERAHRADVRSGRRATAATPTSSSTRRASRRRSRAATGRSRRGSSCAARRSTTSTCRSRRSSPVRRTCGSSSASTRSTRSTTRSSPASTTRRTSPASPTRHHEPRQERQRRHREPDRVRIGERRGGSALAADRHPRDVLT